MPTYTAKYNLAVPTRGQDNWDTLMNANLGTIDSLIASASGQEAVATFSATPVFDLSLGNIHHITLTGNVTSSTVINPTEGYHLFVIQQDSTGGRSFAFPSSFKGAGTISAAAGTAGASSYSVQLFAYLPSTGVYVAVTQLMYGE